MWCIPSFDLVANGEYTLFLYEYKKLHIEVYANLCFGNMFAKKINMEDNFSVLMNLSIQYMDFVYALERTWNLVPIKEVWFF